MIDLFTIIYKWKKQIIAFCTLAVIMSIIISMPSIMPPYFESKMVFYISNPQSTDRANLFGDGEIGSISQFGSKDDINRFITIANSSEVLDYIISKYKLSTHYKIDSKDKQLINFYTKRELQSNYKMLINDEGAIEASIIDTDAQLAANMIKDIVAKSNEIYQNIIKQNKTKTLEQLNQLISENPNDNSVEAEKLRNIYKQYKVVAETDFKSLYIIQDAYPAAKKSKPVRWLIVASTAIAALVGSILLAVIIELFKDASNRNTNIAK
ncbi:MAG: hypothetical protein H6553_02050 [Chitinophagales bacterium]|nr:hypothetical protein [Chitinophagales bacterium]